MEEGAPATDGFSKIWIAQANTSDVWLVDIVDKTFEFAFTGQSLPRDMGFDAHTNDIVQMSNWKLVRTANEPPSRLPISLAPNRGVPNPHLSSPATPQTSYGQDGKLSANLGSIPGAGGPLYLHPRCLTVAPDGSYISIVDFTKFNLATSDDTPSWDLKTAFSFGGTRLIGRDAYFLLQ
jgi:hypothetical protein